MLVSDVMLMLITLHINSISGSYIPEEYSQFAHLKNVLLADFVFSSQFWSIFKCRLMLPLRRALHCFVTRCLGLVHISSST